MRVLVTGVKGQLGYDVMNELAGRGHEGIGVDIQEMDITDAASVEKVITEAAPDAVIHCAAYTAVDAAEDNVDLCRRVNAGGTENIARVCKALNCKMMYISTDYVFNGQGTRPWEPDDKREPLNVYGQTKYEGELAVETLEKFFLVRIAWVFGVNGKNFIKTMLNLGKTRDHLTVVADQIGSPTYTYDLALPRRPWPSDTHSLHLQWKRWLRRMRSECRRRHLRYRPVHSWKRSITGFWMPPVRSCSDHKAHLPERSGNGWHPDDTYQRPLLMPLENGRLPY